MSGKIALPTTPKLESQSLLGETESKGVVTRRLLKGAALGAAAWLIVTSTLGAGPAWDRDGLASFGWGKHKHAQGRVDCSIWNDFDFGEPVNVGDRHARPHAHPRLPPGGPTPPRSPDAPHPPHPPNMPHPPGSPHPPDAPHPPHAPHHPHSPHFPESQIFNISSAVSEIRLASLGFLGHGVFRVEPAAEGVDYAQVEVRGADGRVCVLKDAADEVMGVGLVGYMHGRRHGRGGRRWWHRWGGSKKRGVASPHGHLPPSDTEDQDQSVEDESGDFVNEPPHPGPPSDFPFPPPPPGGRFPPPPPPPGGDFPHPPPPPGPSHPRPHSHPHHTHAVTLITLRVPAADLPALRTRLPLFTHDLASTTATFAGLDLSTRDAAIGLDDVVVRDGGNVTVRSVNAPIRGDIKLLDGWAVLETRNAVVDVNVSLGGKHSSGVEVRSSNAPIISSIELLSSGIYSTSFSTSNAHLALNVTSYPEGARLFLTGHTSNAPANVQLHPEFQGVFELSSSVVTPAVVVADQEGRRVEYERDGGSVKGSVWKKKKEEVVKEGGEVIVSTSNAPNILML
ncbi:hypothetical protein BDV93DRAFT_523859 [Ceratobasidium sp. AG-I]|nr:hypothetical protein BDV93DRAFT_523859 [Ceratobasidium sp. AG-I]